MKDWQRRILGCLALGGGAVGLASIFSALSTDQAISSKVIVALFFPLYAWGIWCGVQMLEQQPKALRANFWFWAIQIPILQSSILSYLLSSGLLIGVWIQFSPPNINFLAWIGSRFDVAVNQPKPLAAGCNAVALVVTLFIWRLRRGSVGSRLKAEQ